MMSQKALERKSNKPIMEKKRRARINHCLNQLKALILETDNERSRHSKLEKADILEMTVRYLQTLRAYNTLHMQQQQQALQHQQQLAAKMQLQLQLQTATSPLLHASHPSNHSSSSSSSPGSSSGSSSPISASSLHNHHHHHLSQQSNPQQLQLSPGGQHAPVSPTAWRPW